MEQRDTVIAGRYFHAEFLGTRSTNRIAEQNIVREIFRILRDGARF